MRNMVNWSNPYAGRDGAWLKGNLHTHTSPASGCGTVPLEETLAAYSQAGYDFLSISDHMVLSQPPPTGRLAFIPGLEWNRPDGGGHTGLYACDPEAVAARTTTTSQEALLADFTGAQTLVILNHPEWQLRPHYRREELMALSGYDGIEVFNGVIKRLHGSEVSTAKWDFLLSQGRRILGYASDDFHQPSDLGHGWNVVRAASPTPEAILAALKSGNFYASSGVTLTDIRREGDEITVASAEAQEIQVIGYGGELLHTTHERRITVDVRAWDSTYLRFAAYGRGSAMAWTQPFFKESE